MFGLSAAMMFSACTTAGQFWHESEKKVSKVKSPFSPRTASSSSASSFGGWPPTWSSARISEVNSCPIRSEEHTSELQSLMRISYAVFCLKKKKQQTRKITKHSTKH